MRQPPTYEELRAKRAEEWASAQRRAAAELQERHAAIAKMPDVKNAPDPDEPWGKKGIECLRCGSEGFLPKRYVTVNGSAHRAELHCLGCNAVETWDFGEKRWLVGK